jgi:hypothetical protein
MLLGLKGEADLTFEHIPTMRGIYGALRDGSMTVEEMFDPRKLTGRGFEQVDNPLAHDFADDQVDGAPPPEAEAKPAAQEQAKPAAADAPRQAKATAPASGGLLPENEPTASSSPAPAAQATAKPEAAKAEAAKEPAKPTSSEEYVEHWRAFCATATTEGAMKNKHSADRALRKSLEPFSEEQFEEMAKIREARVTELRK